MNAVARSLLLALFVAGAARAEDNQTISKFRVPEYDEEMNMKSQLFGDFATLRPDGKVEVSNFKIEFYSKGEVEMRVTSPACVYDRGDGTAESDSSVRIVREKMVVTGEQFAWNSKKEKFKIFRNAKVVLKDVQKDIKTGDSE